MNWRRLDIGGGDVSGCGCFVSWETILYQPQRIFRDTWDEIIMYSEQQRIGEGIVASFKSSYDDYCDAMHSEVSGVVSTVALYTVHSNHVIQTCRSFCTCNY
jgi:hypothetical protein